MKNCRILCLILVFAALLAVMLSCGASEESPLSSEITDTAAPSETSTETQPTTSTQAITTTVPETTATPIPRPTEEELVAKEMVQTIFDNYTQVFGKGDNAVLFTKENYGTGEVGYLWTHFTAVGMQYYMCKLYPDDVAQKEVFRQMIGNFKYYRQANPTGEAVKYHSARGNRADSGRGDCFFDDNIWVARNYLRAYEILGDAWYLEEAIRVNNWVLSGWNNTLGGLVWSENGLLDTANEQHLERGLSANACAIMVNGTLSQLVESPEEKVFYLDWAERFYTFCKKMQNTPKSYDYWNGIHTVIVNGERRDGDINRVHYAYNSGSMILANLVMYECTDDAAEKEAYMTDAIRTAAAAKTTFYRYDPLTKTRYFQGDPWFAAILCEAYYELYKYDEKRGATYLENFALNVKAAYDNRDTASGLCPYQANQGVTWDQNEIRGLHQIGFAEQAVIVALYSAGIKD